MNFLTGYFGMNFTDMPELDPDNSPYVLSGFKFFWALISATLLGVVFLALRMRWVD